MGSSSDNRWRGVKDIWAAAGPNWQFWIDWYEAALEGLPLLGDWDRHWALLTDIARIEDEVWDAGADSVNTRVANIVDQYKAATVARPPVETIQIGVRQNRGALLLQLDALVELIEKGVSDIRGWNAADEIEQIEKKRQLDLFSNLQEAVAAIRDLINKPGEIDTQNAEQIAAWTQVIAKTGKEWNAAAKEYVQRDPAPRLDLTARLVIGGSVAGVLTSLGLPMIGTLAGTTIIGRKIVESVVRKFGSGSSS